MQDNFYAVEGSPGMLNGIKDGIDGETRVSGDPNIGRRETPQ